MPVSPSLRSALGGLPVFTEESNLTALIVGCRAPVEGHVFWTRRNQPLLRSPAAFVRIGVNVEEVRRLSSYPAAGVRACVEAVLRETDPPLSTAGRGYPRAAGRSCYQCGAKAHGVEPRRRREVRHVVGVE